MLSFLFLRRNGENGDRGPTGPSGNGAYYSNISGGGCGGPMALQVIMVGLWMIFMDLVQISHLLQNLKNDTNMTEALSNTICLIEYDCYK